MTTPDPQHADTTPDTAMATGNDEGEPGEQSRAPLTDDEREMLQKLEQPVDGPAVTAVEDSPEAAAAVDDDSPMSVGGTEDDGQDDGQGDGLTPEAAAAVDDDSPMSVGGTEDDGQDDGQGDGLTPEFTDR